AFPSSPWARGRWGSAMGHASSRRWHSTAGAGTGGCRACAGWPGSSSGGRRGGGGPRRGRSPSPGPGCSTLPFSSWGGSGESPPLTPAGVEALRRYLVFGGFLLADANDGSSGRGFDASFRRDLARVLPGTTLEPVPAAHVVFKSFFLLDSAPGRLFLHPQLR